MKLRNALEMFLKVACTFITLIMIYKEIHTFAVVKPTITIQETDSISMDTFPRVFACTQKPLNTNALLGNGYSTEMFRYGLGVLGPVKSKEELKTTGWSGNGTLNSIDLLDQLVSIKSEREIRAYEVGKGVTFSYAKRRLTRATYPYGKCVEVSHKTGNLNNSLQIIPKLVNNNNTVKVILSDPIDDLSFGKKSTKMKGDQIVGKEGMRRGYRVKIKQTLHEENDPEFKCTRYPKEKSLDVCVRRKIYDRLIPHLGCLPPLFMFAGDIKDVCRRNFDFDTDQERVNVTNAMFSILELTYANICEDPCTQMTYETTLLEELPSDLNRIHLFFDPTIEIERIGFRVNFQTFLTRLGGAVSFGRTGLWIFVTALDGLLASWKFCKTFLNFITNKKCNGNG